MKNQALDGKTVSKLVLAIVVGLGIALLALYLGLPSGVVRSLPSEACDIHEQTFRSGPDMTYIVKARMSASSFERWCRAEGFVLAPSNLRDWVAWEIHGAESWWDPSFETEDTLYYPAFVNWGDPNFTSDDYCVVKYENGCMYYKWTDI